MAQWVKQSTSITVKIGPFLDEDDGKTAETGLTITQPDVRLTKNGGNFAQKAAVQTLSHDENGYYGLTLDATDTNTLGRLTVHVHESGALPVWYDLMVVPANVWDSMFGSDKLQTDAVEVSSDSATADEIQAIVTGAGGAIDVDVTGNITGNVTGSVGSVTGSIGSLGATAKTDVNTEVDTALVDIGLDHLVSASVTGSDITNNSIIARLAAKASTADWDTFDHTTDSLEALRDRFDDSVSTQLVSGSTFSGTAGFLSDAISLVRIMTDEPSLSPKYADSTVLEFLGSAFAGVIADLNVMMLDPVLARLTISISSSTREYTLPATVGEVKRVAVISDTTKRPQKEWWPGSEFSGSGVSLEGNVLHFLRPITVGDSIEILYIPQAEASLHFGTGTIPDSLVSSTYKWTASADGTSNYYVELSGGGDPSLTQPTEVFLEGDLATSGTLGSLSVEEWAWGDSTGDSLGYSTVYVRTSGSVDPDTLEAASVQVGPVTTLTLATTPTGGNRDTRANVYAGYMLRIISDKNSIVQERIISEYDNSTRKITLRTAFSPAVYGDTITYEVLPYYTQLLRHVVARKAAIAIMSNEGDRERMGTLTGQMVIDMRGLRQILAARMTRIPGLVTEDDAIVDFTYTVL